MHTQERRAYTYCDVTRTHTCVNTRAHNMRVCISRVHVHTFTHTSPQQMRPQGDGSLRALMLRPRCAAGPGGGGGVVLLPRARSMMAGDGPGGGGGGPGGARGRYAGGGGGLGDSMSPVHLVSEWWGSCAGGNEAAWRKELAQWAGCLLCALSRECVLLLPLACLWRRRARRPACLLW